MLNGQRTSQHSLTTLELSLQYALRDFLLDCQTSNLSPRTLDFYRDKLRPFVSFLEHYGATSVSDLTPTRVREYLTDFASTHSPGGTHAVFRCVRAFSRWLVREGLLEQSPMSKVRPPRVDLAPLPPVPLDTVRAMVKVCGRDRLAVRDRAILLALLDTGLRASEFLSLNVGDVDLEAGAVQARRTKSRKPRVVFLGKAARRSLLACLRGRRDFEPDDPLWVSRLGERLTATGLRKLLERRARLANVAAPSPHSFRRAFALNLWRNGADVLSISRPMGHGSLPVLLRYLKQDASDLAAVHGPRAPGDRL
jgi:site-specific recombinase XerD